ncbi:MAG TPA: protein phosphatase 2C domain-containing protein [Propionibacteriaceae bacterium]|nr:protein phosphatase 2C domain-containing protein [Propionibacteriaceae bacterium]
MATADFRSTSGPSLSFAFNLAKIPDQGEDSDPIVRDGPDLGMVGVFDGMGGAGGTVYETPSGARTGAYIASRVARDVVERRMLDLLEPDWNLNGEAAAEDLQRSVRQALEERLTELKAPPSRLRSKLLRALPTTMAVIALQRTARGGPTWAGHVFWAGDSRAYVVTADGAAQLSTDDLRDPGDALANLRRDSVVSNAMSADTDFHVSYRRVELKAPFLLVCATDGCFGYVPTPMHFEHLLLQGLAGARNPQAWSSALQSAITEITGDDAAMAVMGVGTDFSGFRTLLAPRLAELERSFIAPLDGLRRTVDEAERALQQARQRHEVETAALWAQYQTGYEQHLRPGAVEPDAEEIDQSPGAADETELSDADAEVEETSAEDATEERKPELGRTAEVTS